MTKFNPENKEELTYGEVLDPAMKIKTHEDAIQYFDAYVEYTIKHINSNVLDKRKKAIDIVKQNLGYYAGYYGDATRKRVEQLFLCEHPIFGSIDNETATAKEAFECGKQGKTLNEIRKGDE